MALPATPRLKLPGPSGSDPADVPTDLDKLRQALDPITAVYGQGLANARPLPGVPGRFYFATDLRTLYYDDGQVWQSAAQQPGDLRVSAAVAGGSGWLACDGAAYARNDPLYAPLFAVIQTTWGAGDGSSTFNVPDLRGRALLGAGAGAGLTARALGSRGGEEAHVLAVGEMPSHAHGVSDPGHAHSLYDPGHYHSDYGRIDFMGGAGGTWYSARGWGVAGGVTGSAGTGMGVYAAATGVGVQANGGGGGHNTMPPFAAVNVFIKT